MFYPVVTFAQHCRRQWPGHESTVAVTFNFELTHHEPLHPACEAPIMDLAGSLAAVLPVTEVVEVGEGHRSRVFRVASGKGAAVVKVLDASNVDRTELDVRLDVTAALANLDPLVCRPLMLGEQFVTELAFGGRD